VRTFFGDHPRALTPIVIGAAVALSVCAIVMLTVVLRLQPAAEASPSPPSSTDIPGVSPSALRPSPLPTPMATERPPVASDRGQPVLAVVLVDNLRLREEPGDGKRVGSLAEGDIVSVAGEPPHVIDGTEWYYVEAGHQRVGWVSRGSTDDPYLQLRSTAPVKLPATIEGVAIGDNGFLAWGWLRNRSDEEATAAMLTSADGVTWERSSLEPGPRRVVSTAAWGPAGWFAATRNPYRDKPGEIWHSADGNSWVRFDSNGLDGWIGESMAAGPLGYAMSVRNDDYDYDIAFSTDGRSWRIRHPVFGGEGPGGSFRVFPSQSGLVATGIDPEEGGSTQMALTRDGVHWKDLGWGMPSMQTYHIEAAGYIWSVFIDDGDGRVRIQRAPVAELRDLEFDMRRQDAMEERLTDSMVTALVSSGDHVLMLAYDRSTGAPHLWSTVDGEAWSEGAEGSFGGLVPSILQGGHAGFIAVTEEATLAGGNPVLWHSTDGETWTADDGSSFGVVKSPRIGDCPALPSDYVEWRLVPGVLAADCFGDASITFRAWLTVGCGCGGYVPGIFEPAWLASPFASFGLVWLPYENKYGGCGSGVAGPDLGKVPEPQQWVHVTGHYDDPAATTCRYRPDETYPYLATTSAQLMQECRSRFVVTNVSAE
jgi:hypothetical protein